MKLFTRLQKKIIGLLFIFLFVALSCSFPKMTAANATNIVFPKDSRIINVKDFGAKGDGATDDTAAIRKAILNSGDAKTNNPGTSLIYFPNGTYIVSDTLLWPNTSYFARILQGQSRDGTIIKLKNNAPGFDNPQKPKAILSTFEGEKTGNAFRHSIYDLTVNVGSGNRGAYGIRLTSNNQGGIRNVAIRSNDGKGRAGLALDKAWPGPSMIRGLSVSGFDYGIFTVSPEYSLTFEDITLENQNIAGINNTWNILNIRGLTSRNTVPVIKSEGSNPNDIRSLTVIVDGNFSSGAVGNAAIELNAGHVFLRNITTSGYQGVIKKNGVIIPGKYIKEYVSGNTYTLFPSAQKSLNLNIENTPNVSWDDLSQWANVESYGASGIGDDGFAFDHADWADARLKLPNGREIYLSDRPWVFANNGFGPPEKDRSNGNANPNDGGTITLNGKTYKKGLGVHAPSEIRYQLDGKYSTFSSDIGIDDKVGKQGSVVFEVWADGQRIYKSTVIYGDTATKSINLNIVGKRVLTLVVKDTDDDTEAIQAALDSGKTTVYFPSGEYKISKTLEVRGNVRRIIGLESTLRVIEPLRSQANPVFRIRQSSQDTVVFERFGTGFGEYEYTWFEHASPKNLILRNLAINSAKTYRNQPGSGRIFVEDVVGGNWIFNKQQVWARQINPENKGTKIINNGGNLWILGLKTEKEGVVVETTNNGKTEILGGLLYPIEPVAKQQPAFINDNSSLSVTIAESCYAQDRNYKIAVKETQNGVTKVLSNTPILGRTWCSFSLPLYVGTKK